MALRTIGMNRKAARVQLQIARKVLRLDSQSIDWADAPTAIKQQRQIKRDLTYFSILERLSIDQRITLVSTALCAHRAILDFNRN